MAIIFQAFSTIPETFNNLANSIIDYQNDYNRDFSRVFYLLFIEKVPPFRENWESWQNAIARSFQRIVINPEKAGYIFYSIGEIFNRRRSQLSFLQNIPEQEVYGVLSFWSYLMQIYPTLREINGRPYFHNIFSFMNGFKIEETKVIIIGQDPPYNIESTGCAYHGTVCKSTENLIKFAENDLRMTESLRDDEDNDGQIALSSTQAIQAGCMLTGWIHQKVLLVNTALTIGNRSECHFHIWKPFQDFLLGYFNSQTRSIVFILSGFRAAEMMSSIHQDKHLCINVYHPRNTEEDQTKQQFAWKTRLPFLNANFYLIQNGQDPIDWTSISSCIIDPHMELRKRSYFKRFDKMVQNYLKTISGDFSDYLRVILHKNPKNKRLEFWNQIKAVDLGEVNSCARDLKEKGEPYFNMSDNGNKCLLAQQWEESQQIRDLIVMYKSLSECDLIDVFWYVLEHSISPLDIAKVRGVLRNPR